jgi:glycosyltransferase involved in cell wall biosynthesis
MMKFDIVYVTHDSLSEGIGMSQIVPVVVGLSNCGWKVGIISCEKFSPPSDILELLSKNDIAWKPLNFGKMGASGGLGRLVRIAIRLPRSRAYHCRGDLAAVAVSLRTRKPFLWDVRSLWIDQKQVMGTMDSKSYVVFFAKKLERIAAKNAAAISTLTEAVFPILRKRHSFIVQPNFVVPTCTDLKKFSFKENQPKKKKLLLSGVFNDYYDIPATREFISEFRRKESLEVVWCHGFEAVKSTLGVGEDEIKVLRQFELPEEIESSSFGLALCKTDIGDSLKGVMPTKVAEFLAVGRPVVVSKGIGDLESLLLTTGTGVVVEGDGRKAVLEILSLVSDPHTAVRCRKLAEEHFSMEKAITTYESIFKLLGVKQTGSRIAH